MSFSRAKGLNVHLVSQEHAFVRPRAADLHCSNVSWVDYWGGAVCTATCVGLVVWCQETYLPHSLQRWHTQVTPHLHFIANNLFTCRMIRVRSHELALCREHFWALLSVMYVKHVPWNINVQLTVRFILFVSL